MATKKQQALALALSPPTHTQSAYNGSPAAPVGNPTPAAPDPVAPPAGPAPLPSHSQTPYAPTTPAPSNPSPLPPPPTGGARGYAPAPVRTQPPPPANWLRQPDQPMQQNAMASMMPTWNDPRKRPAAQGLLAMGG